MLLWPEDLSTCTLDEALARVAENRAWSKELRLRTNDLVNTRLAKTISQADYIESRKRAHEDAAECRRRATMLERHINRYSNSPLPQGL
jgi:hypothetical protein